MNTAVRTLILRVDGFALGAFGIFGLTMDLLSYFAGLGSWQTQFLNDPIAVGVVEAHGLAIMMAVLLIRYSGATAKQTGHWLGMMTHILLGTCNLIFWQIFLNANQLPLGYISTSFHWIFVALNVLALFMPEEQALAA